MAAYFKKPFPLRISCPDTVMLPLSKYIKKKIMSQILALNFGRQYSKLAVDFKHSADQHRLHWYLYEA